ncbi:substrate-binding domain-containing protein [Actinospica sp. MGRD01-02]|uniref:Substrate-binding domain-containing protein n=1 Tax=Actinospica acidithermotolerans TaxID=2828514 RepID=A0A941IHZ1_9ACTN|nr:substrate-binding domain-containing protein [Actinospica acidithermotolerans]MBR7827759.1 substrate-binding domain-containing protein [Actinospica acidithermotolerans]
MSGSIAGQEFPSAPATTGAEGGSLERRSVLRALGLGGGAALAATALAACSSSRTSSSTGSIGDFPKTSAWKFAFINHVTTNSFFAPTQSGMKDAASLLGLPAPTWTGSENGVVSEMVSAFETAISANVAGIAIPLTDSNAFIAPTKAALAAGIPVIAYNANASGNYALAYVGQDLYQSGYQMGLKIATEVTSGDILVGISQPGSLNVQPRLDGLKAALAAKAPGVTVHTVDTGAAQADELSAMESAYQGLKAAKGIYAVDAGSTASIAEMISKYGIKGQVHAGGYDLLADSITGVSSGALDFTIDQSAYLQGFLPVLYMFMYRMTGTLVFPPATDTGLTFVTSENVSPYASSKSWIEGGANKAVVPMPSSIGLPAPSTVQS